MSIGPRIIEIRLLQALIWNLKVKFMRVVIGQGNAVSPVSNWFTSFLLCINLTNNSWYTTIWNLTLKIQGQDHGWGQSYIVRPASNQFISFLWCVNWTNYLWDMANRMFDLVKLDGNFERKNSAGNKVSNILFPKYNQIMNMARGIYNY